MLLGRVYRRLNSDANVKLFSGNTSLLETFSQIVGSSRDRTSLKEEGGEKPAVPSYSKMLMAAEPASEFNEQGSSNLNITQVHRFRSGEFYRPADLIAPKGDDMVGQHLDPEIRRHVDVFRRSRVSALHTHHNSLILSTMISQTGKILPQKQTGHSSKTQRQLSKAIRRARQMGLLPYMHKPKQPI